jgi:hypothetical protein
VGGADGVKKRTLFHPHWLRGFLFEWSEGMESMQKVLNLCRVPRSVKDIMYVCMYVYMYLSIYHLTTKLKRNAERVNDLSSDTQR